MPLYEYQCDSCGARFEVIQKFSDAPLVTHEGCGGHVERLLSAPALQFKGSGWYITDYARANGKNEAKPANASTESKDAGKKSESTPVTPAKSESSPKSDSSTTTPKT